MVNAAARQLAARFAVVLHAAFRHRFYVTDRSHFAVTWDEQDGSTRFTFRVTAPNVFVAGDGAPSVARTSVLLSAAEVARLLDGSIRLAPDVVADIHDLVTEAVDAIVQTLVVRAFCTPPTRGAA